LYGNEIKKGFSIKEASIFDIVPTILNLMHLLVPPDLDGRVLTEVLQESNVTPEKPERFNETEYLRRKIKELKYSGKIK